jgi:hypothetical protein
VALATEFRLEGTPPGLPGTVLFDEEELRRVVVDGLDWELASPLELSSSEDTLATVIEWESLFETHEAQPTTFDKVKDMLGMEVRLPPPEVRETSLTFPHLVLRLGEHLWTSVHLALIKPGG